MKSRMKKIGVRMTLIFVLFALILCVAISVFGYFTSYRIYSDFYSQKAQQIARMAATFIDGDKIGDYLVTREFDEYYEQLQKIFRNIKKEHDVMYLYIFVPELDSFTYILEAALETDAPSILSYFGEVYPYGDVDYKYLVPDILAKRASTDKIIINNSVDGVTVSAWAPVFNSNGDLVAMAEADLSLDLVYRMLNSYMTSIGILSCIIIIVMVIILAVFNHGIVTHPLTRLTANALNFVSGDELNYVSEIKTGDEMQTLSEAFQKMSGDINGYIRRLEGVAADKERIATELNVAVGIRKSLLPKPFDVDEAFGVSALMNSAREVGGDFYDFFFIDERRVCVVMANVCGRGIPTALFMVVAKTMIKNQMMTGMPVEEAMTLVNTRLFESNSGSMPVAAFVGVLEKDTGSFSYVNAGGETPLIMRRGVGFEWLRDQTASSLAASENVKYRRMELTLRQGDKLFLYTYGVPALKNSADRELGKETLCELLNLAKPAGKEADELLREFNNELLVFTDDVERADDATMLLLTYDKGDRTLVEISVPPRADSFNRVLPFIKNQLNENGLGGAFYAGVAIALEEIFVIVVSRVSGGEFVTVRCGVSEGQVGIKLLYGGRLENPLESASPAERDALAFIRKNASELNYAVQEGKNVLTIVKVQF